MTVTSRFQSTPSGGKATSPICVITPERAFQSTPSGGKATLFFLAYLYDQPVSIHAFRGEGDTELEFLANRIVVSIHAFRGEGDKHQSSFSASSSVSIHAFRGEGDRNI